MILRTTKNGSPLFMGFIVIFVFTMLLVKTWYDELHYTQNGKQVTVSITRVEHIRSHAKRNKDTAYAYGEYDLNGTTYEARIMNVEKPFDGMKAEGYVLPDDTDTVYVSAGTGKLMGKTAFLAAFGGGCGILLITAGKGKRNDRKFLAEFGTNTEGTVVDRYFDEEKGQLRYYSVIRYTDEYGAGREFTYSSDTELETGENVTVRYAVKNGKFIEDIL